MVDHTTVYTDGACSGNPGPGGWAWVVPEQRYGAGYASDTTNQRMELTAALEAVHAIEGPVEVISDSTYVVNCFRDGWWRGWLERDWKTSARKPVANRDLWEPLVTVVRHRDISFRWVKGHSGDRWNDIADWLAVEAMGRARNRSGDGVPAPLEADGPPSNELTGYPVVVLGHRPPDIGGYEPNPTAEAIGRRLEAIITAKHELIDDLVVLSGLRLGAEQLGAEAALRAGVPLVAVLPYPEPETVWPPAAQAHFRELRDAADQVRTLQKKVPTDKAGATRALQRRDGWLARHAAEAVVVWDGQDQLLGQIVKKLERALGDEVWIVDPAEC